MICLTWIALDAMRARTRPCDAMRRTRGQQRTLTPRLIVVGSRSLIRARERSSCFLSLSLSLADIDEERTPRRNL